MNLKKCRMQKGILQKDLASKLGVTLETVSRWERGKIEPNIKYIIKMSEILEVTTDQLLKE